MLGHDVQIIELSTLVNEPVSKLGGLARKIARIFGGDTVGSFVDRLFEGRRVGKLASQISHDLAHVDVLHFHDFLRIAGLARKLRSKHVVIWTNHLGEFIRLMNFPGGRLLTRGITRAFDAAIGPSDQLSDPTSIHPPSRYIPNGVAIDRFPFADASENKLSRTSLGLSSQQLVLVPRRWAPTKGVLEAAQAARILASKSITFAFLGSAGATDFPAYGLAIEKELAGLKNVMILPSVGYDQMAIWLRAADIVLVPSKLEATSLSVLEAMSAGAIVLASSAGGLSQLITHEKTGFLMEDARAEIIASAISGILGGQVEVNDRIKRQARDMVVDTYSWELVARSTVDVYSSAIRARQLRESAPVDLLGRKSR